MQFLLIYQYLFLYVKHIFKEIKNEINYIIESENCNFVLLDELITTKTYSNIKNNDLPTLIV